MRINSINAVRYQTNFPRTEVRHQESEMLHAKTQVNPSFKSDAGALKGMLWGAGIGIIAATAVVLTGGAAALGVPALGIFGAGAGAGAQAGGIVGGLASGKD